MSQIRSVQCVCGAEMEPVLGPRVVGRDMWECCYCLSWVSLRGLRFMEVAGLFDRTSRKPHVDAVVGALARLIVTVRPRREPLVDALYQYRRREGVFIDLSMMQVARWRRVAA